MASLPGILGKRGEHRANDLGVALDGHSVELAVDHEPIEARRFAYDDRVGLVDPAFDDGVRDDRRVLVADAELEPGAAVVGERDAQRALEPPRLEIVTRRRRPERR